MKLNILPKQQQRMAIGTPQIILMRKKAIFGKNIIFSRVVIAANLPICVAVIIVGILKIAL